MSDRYNRICWKGDWRELPQSCGGNVEVWDQTIGCPECGMNLWYLPEHGEWPAWDAANEPPADHWQRCDESEENPYDAYATLFERIHPFIFDHAHDDGDADDALPRWTVGP